MTTIVGTVTDMFSTRNGINVQIMHQDGKTVFMLRDASSVMAATIRGAAARDDEIEIGYRPFPAMIGDIAGEIFQVRITGYQVEELPYAA